MVFQHKSTKQKGRRSTKPYSTESVSIRTKGSHNGKLHCLCPSSNSTKRDPPSGLYAINNTSTTSIIMGHSYSLAVVLLVIFVVIGFNSECGLPYAQAAAGGDNHDDENQQQQQKQQQQEPNHHQKMMDWLNSRDGGFVSPKIEMRRVVDPTNTRAEAEADAESNSMMGLFAMDDIAKDEILIHVPWDSLISSDEEGQWERESYLSCGTTRNLLKEFQKGPTSEFAPYVDNYLKSLHPMLPSAWSSEASKSLFIDIIDGDNTRQSLPPYVPFHYYDEWIEFCKGDPDDLNAAMLVISRADEEIMVPIYDLMNHRNDNDPLKMNMISAERKHGVYHQTRAIRDIQAGEEIFNSYNLCDGCASRLVNFGTPEIFNDYGFVESMPQRWYFFYWVPMRFELDNNIPKPADKEEEEEDGADDDDKDMLTTRGWWNVPLESSQKDALRHFFQHELRRLYRLKNRIHDLNHKEEEKEEERIPADEWQSIWTYYDALVNAMTFALESVGGSKEEICAAVTNNNGVDPCSHYVDPERVDDDLPYALTGSMCRSNYADDSYSLVETVISLDDDLSTIVDFREKKDVDDDDDDDETEEWEEEDDDDDDDEICMFQNDELVICPSIRPFAYEPLVHFPAQFLETVRQVLIVGGGNGMALFEVLKYPGLKNVVVVEGHQSVAQKSFEYLDTAPYFDDERVEWWFGSMDLSFLFGSTMFDLIIIENGDLSDETFVRALACLLDNDGVIAAYSTDMATLSRVFKYATQVIFDEPAICKYESMVIASHQTDILETSLNDHDVNVLVFEPLEDSVVLFDMLHNYNNNTHKAQASACQENTKGYEIMETMEMEGITIPSSIQTVLRNSMPPAGFPVLSDPFEESARAFILVTDGAYLAVRTSAEAGSVGVDIHAWNSTYVEMKHLREIIVDVLGPKEVSSYRLFLEDSKCQGIGECASRPTTWVDNNQSEDTAQDLTDELKLLLTSSVYRNPYLELLDNHVGVLCGVKEVQQCQGYKVLAKSAKSGSVTTFWTCPELSEEVQNSEDLKSAMIACEKRLTKQLNDLKQPLYALVIDPSVGPSMLQVFDSMLSSASNQMKWFEFGRVFLALAFDNKTKSSRMAILDRIRQYLREDPAARAEYVIIEDETTSQQHLELGMVVSGLPNPFDLFVGFQKEMEKQLRKIDDLLNKTIYLRQITGGTLPLESDFFDLLSTDTGVPDYDQGVQQSHFNNNAGARPYVFQTVLRFQIRREAFVEESGSPLSFHYLIQTLEKAYSEMDNDAAVWQSRILQNAKPSIALLSSLQQQQHQQEGFSSILIYNDKKMTASINMYYYFLYKNNNDTLLDDDGLPNDDLLKKIQTYHSLVRTAFSPIATTIDEYYPRGTIVSSPRRRRLVNEETTCSEGQ